MKEINEQLKHTLNNFEIDSNIGEYYKGKVRDNYHMDDKILMVTSDRVSAFDHVLGTIPFKGQILTEIANFWFDKTKDIVPNHIISSPDPQVLMAKKAKTLPVEIIIRQYITGSLWREYSSGINGQYGFDLEDGLKQNQKFDLPIITPSTKAEYGEHDEPISREEIVKDLVPEKIYAKAEEYALELFRVGQEWANKMGLILVDTKYEFGIYNDELIVIDEIHTPDSSRYWIADSYNDRMKNNKEPQNIDKEFLRLWFVDNCDPYNDKKLPNAPEELILELSSRYIYLYETITGGIFPFPSSKTSIQNRITNNLKGVL